MKISEYNVFEENKHIKENIQFPAVQNNVTSKETYLQNIESLKTNEENILQKQGKVTQNTDNKNVVKKLLQKVTEATSSLIGNVAVTAVVAVTSVIVFTSILIKAPNIELLDLIAGYDYVSYNLYIDETSEDMDYYVTISSNFENYRYELDDGENIGRVDNLRHNMEYELSVIGIGKSDNQEVKYFETKFYTTVSVKIISVKWIVDGITVEEDQIEEGVTPIYDGSIPEKNSTNELNYTFLQWNESIDENGNITYIAEFTSSTRLYNVKWIVEDIIVKEDEIEYGKTPSYDGVTPVKPSTNEYNYTFLQWNESTDENGNITYIAEFTQTTRLYNVAWVVDGITVEEDQIEYGETPIYNGSTPLKSSTDELDFTFLQWNETTDEIGNFTYVAEFISTVRLYTVTWIVEGVTVEEDQIEYGQIPVFDGATPTKEMTIDEEYTFIGWDNNITNVTSDITYTAVFETIIHEYTATFVVPTQSNITINYDNSDYYVISINTEFDNTTDARLLYRIILTDVQTNTQYIYEGTDSIATIDVLSTVKDMTITYELVGIYNNMEKLYEVVELTEHIAISDITSQIIDDYQLIGIDSYEFKMIINSDYSNEEVYNYVELVINYDDLSQQEILLEDVVVNEEMSIFIEVPSFCGSFTIDYRISLLDRYGQSERIIEESTEITLESIYELTNVYIDSRQFMTARFDFIYHLTDENTTIAVKDSTSGEVATLTEGYDYIEISINSTAQDLTYYLSNINNEVLDTETIISFDSANITGDYSFNYVNPGDAIVTFNDDGTMNIYLDTLFETEDPDIYYLIRYNDFNSESIYEVKYTDSVAVIENIPFSNYGIVYYVYKTVEGIDYQLEYIAVSGGVEITYDSIVSGYTQIDNNNNLGLYLSFSEYSNVNLDSFVLLIDQEEIIISSSDFVLTDGTYEFTYILEQEPSKLQVQYEATYNNETIYESVLLSGKIKGEQYRIMYCSVIE